MRTKKNKNAIPPPPDDDASPEEFAAYFEKYELSELEAAGYVDVLPPGDEKEIEELASMCETRTNERRSRTQLNLALSPEQLERFTQYANKKHLPPSTLARAWVLERLDAELERMQ